jgi:hypothetical protein
MERADGAGNGIASLPIFPPHLPPTEPVLANHRSENLRSLHQKRAGGFRACGAGHAGHRCGGAKVGERSLRSAVRGCAVLLAGAAQVLQVRIRTPSSSALATRYLYLVHSTVLLRCFDLDRANGRGYSICRVSMCTANDTERHDELSNNNASQLDIAQSSSID